MLKILQAKLQQYVNCELPDVQADFRKGRGTRDQIANICWIIEKARQFQKNIYFCFMDYAKALTVWITRNWKILKVMGLDAMILVLWMLNLKPTFSLSSFIFIKRLFSSSLSAIRVVSSAYLTLLIFLLAMLIPAYASSMYSSISHHVLCI